jgi:hypothetical protein
MLMNFLKIHSLIVTLMELPWVLVSLRTKSSRHNSYINEQIRKCYSYFLLVGHRLGLPLLARH